MAQSTLSPGELLEAWAALGESERVEGFTLLSREDAQELLFQLDSQQQAELLMSLPLGERRLWLRLLPPDDAADIVQLVEEDKREPLIGLLDDFTAAEVRALLAYEEDEAGGLMNPRFARLRPEMTVGEALSYLRRQTRERVEQIYYAYVLDANQRLLGVVSLRDLVTAPVETPISQVMESDLVSVHEETDQEAVSQLLATHDLMAVPVVDSEGRMKGIVTVDDIVDVVQEEATEDMHKIGAIAVLDAPYLAVGLRELVQKRVVWLIVLVALSFLAALAMHSQSEKIQTLGLLATFVPLIVSTGGNSGSQAATLVIRAMALGEVGLRDWWRVVRRELAAGVLMGAALGVVGLCGVLIWHLAAVFVAGEAGFGPYVLLVGSTMAVSILAVVTWGTLAGCLLPFGLRGFGFDPASASAPLVATIVDATGVMLYFTIAGVMLRGTLL